MSFKQTVKQANINKQATQINRLIWIKKRIDKTPFVTNVRFRLEHTYNYI